MKNLRTFTTFACLGLTALFSSCTEEAGSSLSPENRENVSFSYQLSASHQQTLYGTAVQRTVQRRLAENVIAKMIISDGINGTADTVDWHLTMDEELVTISSNMTQVLAPSTYSFELDIVKGDIRYVGQAENIVLQEGAQSDIEIRVHPVIGDNTLGFTINNMPTLDFSYPAEELAALVEPKIGYIIDGGTEVIVGLNASSGNSEVYVNASEGSHTIELKLYDGNKQVGKSQLQQQSVTIVPNGDILMDIIPVHCEVTVSIPIDGGAGTLSLSVPGEVVTEAGSLANLKTVVQLTSPGNGSHESELTLVENNGSYSGSVTFPSLQYDTVAIAVTFIDVTTQEVLGSSVFDKVLLNESGTTLLEAINLIRRAVISGNLLATTGVNVYDTTGTPIIGAEIFLDDELVGITGSAWGTPGYVKFHHVKGDYLLKAQSGKYLGDSIIALTPLGIRNYAITLDSLIDDYTKLLLHFDNNEDSLKDASIYKHPVFLSAGTINATDLGNRNGSIYLSNAYVSIPDSPELDLDTVDFTIDGWVNIQAQNQNQFIINKGQCGSGVEQSYHISVNYWETVNKGKPGVITADAAGGVIEGNRRIDDGNWHHFALVRNNTQLLLFIDGEIDGQATLTPGARVKKIGSNLEIGGHANGGPCSWELTGYLDEIRVSKGIAHWTSNFIL